MLEIVFAIILTILLGAILGFFISYSFEIAFNNIILLYYLKLERWLLKRREFWNISSDDNGLRIKNLLKILFLSFVIAFIISLVQIFIYNLQLYGIFPLCLTNTFIIAYVLIGSLAVIISSRQMSIFFSLSKLSRIIGSKEDKKSKMEYTDFLKIDSLFRKVIEKSSQMVVKSFALTETIKSYKEITNPLIEYFSESMMELSKSMKSNEKIGSYGLSKKLNDISSYWLHRDYVRMVKSINKLPLKRKLSISNIYKKYEERQNKKESVINKIKTSMEYVLLTIQKYYIAIIILGITILIFIYLFFGGTLETIIKYIISHLMS